MLAAEYVVDTALFRDALERERKRAERFEQRFAVAVISQHASGGRPLPWPQIAEALARAAFADVIGWIQQGSTLGVIRSLADRLPEETPADIAAGLLRQLKACLPSDIADCCSIHLEVHAPHGTSAPEIAVEAPTHRRHIREMLRDSAKRTLDLLGSAVLLIVFAPVFLVVSILVKWTSKGPVLFRQQRIGEHGRPFLMLKFRTMRVDADHRIHQQYVENFIHMNDPAAAAGSVFKIVDDPRVTPIGRFLRRSSLDEFPQFWNVLRGDMSLVGPRPPLSYEVAQYKQWHRRRILDAKPGITGLWQVTGRSRTTFDEMVRLDLRYARRRSVWTDVKILLATPRAVLSGKGAH